jgi:hypothetical protein
MPVPDLSRIEEAIRTLAVTEPGDERAFIHEVVINDKGAGVTRTTLKGSKYRDPRDARCANGMSDQEDFLFGPAEMLYDPRTWAQTFGGAGCTRAERLRIRVVTVLIDGGQGDSR